MKMILFLIVSFLASVAGAICGIGGGVIIKPVLDMLRLVDSVETISFLSGCTVLAMSGYSVCVSLAAGEKMVNLKTGTPLALGAAAGGIAGKQLFSAVKNAFENPNMVGAVQSACLAVITLGVLIYTLFKSRVRPRRLKGTVPCAAIGFLLGILSSFLGIGGGPINLAVLFYFFGMDTKTAAANSLYVILFSQLASLITTLFTGVPEFSWQAMILMVAGGIGGGIVGHMLNRKMDNRAVDRLFLCLMVVIVAISVFNAWRYSVL